MGVKKFFSKIGNGLKKAGRWIRDKAIPFVGRIAKPILSGIAALPGNIGLVGKLGSAMVGIATGVVDKIPNDKLRNQMNDWIKHEANLGREGIRKATDIAQRANDAINTVRDGVNNQIKPIVNEARRNIVNAKS